MKASIMQPTYLPWMGYFGMMDLSDTFIFYNDVQFERQSWQQRNKIKSPDGKWMWLSVPVIHNHRQDIKDVLVDNNVDWRYIHWKSISFSYGKYPFFKDFHVEINKLYQHEWKYLGDMNTNIIKVLAEIIGIRIPEFLESRELIGITGEKTDRVYQILERINADELIVGPGTRDYLDVNTLKGKGIKVYWYEFQHPVYPQFRGEFIAYLSILDLIFNTGKEAVNFLRSGSKDALRLDTLYSL
jgi:hypothetical protein